VQEVKLAEVLGDLALDRALEGESNSSSVLRAGKRAALILVSPPWLSLDATSVESNASAKRS
jgi:hypothetical protein